MLPLRQIVHAASNVRGGENPAFCSDDFKAVFPQFWDNLGDVRVPEPVLDMYIDFAMATVKESRYRKVWKMATCLFVAHFLTLYLQTMVDVSAPAAAVIQAGQTKGLTASKSVDSVSVSYDFTTALSDLDGWAAWKLTTYGVQFATIAKQYGMGGMYVW